MTPTRCFTSEGIFTAADSVRYAATPGVTLFSLQKREGADQLTDLPAGMSVTALPKYFDDGHDAFLDSAAVIQNLDLVITSDTAIAHLAGALGRPVWIILKRVPDWRWGMHREDSPWYPTARLFRQEQRDNWGPVFRHVAAELVRQVEKKKRLKRLQ